MQPKLIAFDLDRTLLLSSGELSPENRAALAAAAERGALLVPASGRPFTALPQGLFEIPGIEYAITGNGCAVNVFPGGERIESAFLAPECTREILDICRGMNVFYECFVNGRGYTDAEYLSDPVRYGADREIVGYLAHTRTPVEDMHAFIAENIARLDALDIVTAPGTGMEALRRQLTESVEGVYITSSAHDLIEISDASCGKGSALRRLCARLGIDRNDVAAFGDADNDADMLRFAGTGIAVANASAMCRSAADMLTLSNYENGVAYALAALYAGSEV